MYKTKIISIEGIEYSGKIQLFNDLRKHYKDNPDICFISQPESTITDSNCISISDLRDIDPIRYSFEYHLDKLDQMYKAVKNALDCKTYKLIITQGSIYSLKAIYLARDVNNDNITFTQYQLYNSIFNRFANELTLDGVIHFQAGPEICHLRSQLMDDIYSYDLQYFEEEQEAYTRWLNVISAVLQIKINGFKYLGLDKCQKESMALIDYISNILKRK